jgi:pyruvate formate lyase activating enzyme
MFNERLCRKFHDCIAAAPGIIREENGDLIILRNSTPEYDLRNICLTRALTISGENKSTDELIGEISKDISFFRQSQGGVTLSGGEALAQDGTLIDLLKELRNRKINVSVETSLHVPWKKIQKSLGYIGTYLVDPKHTNQKKFKEFTGGNAGLIIRNLRKLVDSGARVIIRIPVIPGFNHTSIEMTGLIDFISSLSTVNEIHFIPYHILGIEKYRMLGREYDFQAMSPVEHNELNEYISYAGSKGFKTRIGG